MDLCLCRRQSHGMRGCVVTELAVVRWGAGDNRSGGGGGGGSRRQRRLLQLDFVIRSLRGRTPEDMLDVAIARWR